eukprot:Sspe_Gene.20411::Locus_7484_Transcript_1_1_Confidence_1.000_Length_3906::g.20411::m.20411
MLPWEDTVATRSPFKMHGFLPRFLLHGTSGQAGRRRGGMGKKIGKWRIRESLGSGSFGEVRLGEHVDTGERAAIKIYAKQLLSKGQGRSMLEREIATMKTLNHPNVLRLLEVLETSKHFYIIVELAEGGELFDHITNQKRFEDETARKYFSQIIAGVRYCHERGVVHRDLKPQNLLLTRSNELKIADFGFSNFQNYTEDGKVTPSLRLNTCCGTPNYAAPEVFLGKGYNGFKTDIWSCGVILYVMLCGQVPFKPTGKVQGLQGIILSIIEGRYKIPPSISSGAADLIRKVLVTDPEHRLSLSEMLRHPWVARGATVAEPERPIPVAISDEQIRQSIRLSAEVDDDSPALPGQATQEVLGVVRKPVEGVLDALVVSPGSPPVESKKMGDLSKDVLEVLPTMANSTYDDHGRQRGDLATSSMFMAKGGHAETPRTEHEFTKGFVPALCFYCGKFIYGTGMTCARCKCPVHIKCSDSASQYSWCEQYHSREK